MSLGLAPLKRPRRVEPEVGPFRLQARLTRDSEEAIKIAITKAHVSQVDMVIEAVNDWLVKNGHAPVVAGYDKA